MTDIIVGGTKNSITSREFAELANREHKNIIIAIESINEILNIIKNGFYPKGTSYKARCIDCCYRRICSR